MSKTFEPLQYGSDTTITITFTSDGSTAVDIGASPTTLNIVWTPDDPDASTITTTGSVVGDGSGGQATFTLSASAYSSLTAPVRLYGVPKCVTSGGVNYIGDSVVLPIEAADYPNTTGLCTLSRLKQYLKVQNDDNDDLLKFYIRAATSQIEQMTGRTSGGFVNGSFTETLSGENYESIQLSNWPIESVTSVTTIAVDGSTDTVASTDYRFDPQTGVLSLLAAQTVLIHGHTDRDGFATNIGGPSLGFGRRPAFGRGVRNVQVVYVGGYDPDEIPENLQLACLILAASRYREGENDNGMQSETLGDYSYTRRPSSEAQEQVTSLIQQFRRIRL